MIETHIFSPYFALAFGAILQSVLLVTYAFYERDYAPEKRWKKILYNFFMQFGFNFYFLFGLVMLDTSILWLFGGWNYLDWRFQLPSVLLNLFLGFQFFVGSMLVYPKKSHFIYTIVATIIMLLLLHVYIPLSTNLRVSVMATLGIMILLQLIYMVINGVISYFEKKERWKARNKPLWDIRTKFKKIFNRKVNIILYVLAMTEILLKLMGTSILTWFF